MQTAGMVAVIVGVGTGVNNCGTGVVVASMDVGAACVGGRKGVDAA